MHTIKKSNKKYLKYILCASLLFLLCGCSKKEEYRITYQGNPDSSSITIIEGTELTYQDFEVEDITGMDKSEDLQGEALSLKKKDLTLQLSKGWDYVGEQTLTVTYRKDKAEQTFKLEILGHDYRISYIKGELPITIDSGDKFSIDDFEVEDITGVDGFNNSTRTVMKLDEKDLKFTYDEKSFETQTLTVTYKNIIQETFELKIRRPQLETPEIKSQDGKIIWDVDKFKVGYYILFVNGTPSDPVSNSPYSLENWPHPAEKYSVQIQAFPKESDAVSLASEKSEVCELTKLSAPSNITYSDGILRWNAVSGAERYTLTVEDLEKSIFLFNSSKPIPVDKNEYACSFSESGKYKISIKAISTKSDIVASNVAEVVLQKRDSVTNLDYSNGQITWDKIEGISKYLVTVNGKEMGVVNKNSYNMEFELGKEYNVLVEPVSSEGEVLISVKENVPIVMSYQKLVAPNPVLKKSTGSNLEYVIELPEVKAATGYNIQVTYYVGTAIEDSWTERNVTERKKKFTIDDDVAKKITKIVASVTAVNAEGRYAASDSTIVELEVEHKKLATPKPVITSGNYKNTYILKFNKVNGADEYEVTEIYYTQGGKEYSQKPYRTKDLSLEFEIPYGNGDNEVPAKVSKIEVLVTAISKSGVHETSEPGRVVKQLD